MHMQKRVVLLITTVLLALLITACGQSAATATPVPAAAPTKAAVAAPTSAAPAATVVPPTATRAAEKPAATATVDDTLSLNDRETGLDKLKSYRLHWVAEWKSTDAGKAEAGTWDWTAEYTANPPVSHITWSMLDKSQPQTEWWQTADAFYMLSRDADGKTQCTVMSEEGKVNDVQEGLFNPSSLGSVKGAKYVGTDDVNGVRAKHYKYDESAATLGAGVKVSGDIWVAVDGGFVVRETTTWKGAGLFGQESATAQGEGKWTWELSDVNKALTVKPPDSCQSKAAGLPIMKDATEKTTMGDIIMYKSASTLADVTAFYEKEMVAAGYTMGEKQDMGDITMLSFEKAGDNVVVTITTDAGKTQVMINVSQ